jgi:hypothetical protein
MVTCRTLYRELDSDFYLHNTHVQNGPLQSMREYKKDLYYPDVEEQEQLLEVDDDATSLHTSSHTAAAAANDAWQDSSSRVRQVIYSLYNLLLCCATRTLQLVVVLSACAYC